MAIRRRLPGDPFRVRAAEWNDIVDTVQRVRNIPSVGGGSIRDASIIGGGIIRVKNTTAETVPQYGVLGIAAGPLMPPTASETDTASTATWFSQIVMKGHLPKEIVDSEMETAGIGSSAHAFCITLEPLLPGVTGFACVSGLIHARVASQPNDNPPMPIRVGAVDGSVMLLQNQIDGPCEIVHRSGIGGSFGDPVVTFEWALVRMSAPPIASFPARIESHTVLTEHASFGDIRWSYGWRAVVPSGLAWPDNWDSINVGTAFDADEALNGMEQINTPSATVWGNGVAHAFLPSTYMLSPVMIQTIVDMYIDRNPDGSRYFWFSSPNGIRPGACPEIEV